MMVHLSPTALLFSVCLMACGPQEGGDSVTLRQKKRPAPTGHSVSLSAWDETSGTPISDDELARFLRACEIKADNREGKDDEAIIQEVGLSKRRWKWVRLLVCLTDIQRTLDRDAEDSGWTQEPRTLHAQNLRIQSWMPKLAPYLHQAEYEWFCKPDD